MDTGADRTALDAGTLSVLGLQSLQPTETLGGVGGRVDSVQVETQLRLKTTAKTTILI